MTDTTRMIFDHYEIRKTNKQKSDFIQWIKPTVEQEGYKVEIEKGLCGARNIVIGDPAKANVIYTAHYDTCASLPFPNFITPKCFAIYLLYQVEIVVGVFVGVHVSNALATFAIIVAATLILCVAALYILHKRKML